MNLKQLLDLLRYDRGDNYSTIQTAYEEVARSFRIHQYVFPVIFTGAFRTNHFLVKHNIGDDKICFKEIRSMGLSTTGNPDNQLSNIGLLDVFRFSPDTNHGIPELRFNAVNEAQTKNPNLIFKGDVVECDNIEGEVFTFLFGYPYPYFCIPINPVTGIDNYNIAQLVATYGEQYLIIDDALSAMFIPKYLSIKSQKEGDVSLASNYDYHFAQMINVFNKNRESFQHNNWIAGNTIPALV